jgi:hypothetical protein
MFPPHFSDISIIMLKASYMSNLLKEYYYSNYLDLLVSFQRFKRLLFIKASLYHAQSFSKNYHLK